MLLNPCSPPTSLPARARDGSCPGAGPLAGRPVARTAHRSSRRPVLCASSARTAQQAGVPPPVSTSTSSSPSWVSREARDGLYGEAVQQMEPVPATVVGRLPPWLEGDLLTNGGGYYSGMVHLFDGQALVSKMSIRRGGRVTAMQRYVQTQQFRHISSTGRMKYREFATPLPAEGPLGAANNVVGTLVALMSDGSGTTDNASVNVIPLPDGTLMACSETINSVYRIDRDTLDTLDRIWQPSDGLPGQLQTAHPKMMADGRTLVNFTHSLPFGGIHVYKQDIHTLKRTQVAFIRHASPVAPCWIHDFSISQNYAIIVEAPLFMNTGALILGYETQHLFMDWEPEQQTRVHVVRLDGSGYVTHTAPPFFAFHHINAFEEGSMIHVDMAAYRDPEVLNDLRLPNMRGYPGANISPSYAWRLSIPAAATTPLSLPAPRDLIKDTSQHGAFCEFPAVNPAVRMKPYRYAYCLAAARPTNMGNSLAKLDLATGTAQLWHEPGAAPGEPVFVAAPGATAEDEGVVLCGVMGAAGQSFLVVLDAASWQEVARAQLPYPIPNRFHGVFLPPADSRQ